MNVENDVPSAIQKGFSPKRTGKILPRMRLISSMVEAEEGECKCGLAYRVVERAFADD